MHHGTNCSNSGSVSASASALDIQMRSEPGLLDSSTVLLLVTTVYSCHHRAHTDHARPQAAQHCALCCSLHQDAVGTLQQQLTRTPAANTLH